MNGLHRGMAVGLLIELVVALLIWTAVARAAPAPLYTAAHQHAGGQVTNPQRFNAIVGYPKQCVQGIPCWTYTKGTRSPNAHWPESWYLHVGGARVKDKLFNLYVMDPRVVGWQQQVANACGQHCFIDGMGTSSLSRATPRIPWTAAQWVAGVALIVKAVTATGKQALPNSVGSTVAEGAPIISAAGGQGSTEGFTASNAQGTLSRGAIWVQEIGGCLDKYNAYIKYRGAGDHFACYMRGTLPWDTSWLTP